MRPEDARIEGAGEGAHRFGRVALGIDADEDRLQLRRERPQLLHHLRDGGERRRADAGAARVPEIDQKPAAAIAAVVHHAAIGGSEREGAADGVRHTGAGAQIGGAQDQGAGAGERDEGKRGEENALGGGAHGGSLERLRLIAGMAKAVGQVVIDAGMIGLLGKSHQQQLGGARPVGVRDVRGQVEGERIEDRRLFVLWVLSHQPRHRLGITLLALAPAALGCKERGDSGEITALMGVRRGRCRGAVESGARSRRVIRVRERVERVLEPT